MAVSKLPRPRHIPRNRISAEKPPEGRARTPRYPQVSRRRGGGEAKKSGERAVARHGAGRERWQGTEQWEGVGQTCLTLGVASFGKLSLKPKNTIIKARRTPCAKTSACQAAFSRARAILSRRLCYLYSLIYSYIYFIFNIYLYFSTLYSFFYFFYTLIKNRVGEDGVPAILQYRPSDLYLTDRKETMAILQKDTPRSSFSLTR